MNLSWKMFLLISAQNDWLCPGWSELRIYSMYWYLTHFRLHVSGISFQILLQNGDFQLTLIFVMLLVEQTFKIFNLFTEILAAGMKIEYINWLLSTGNESKMIFEITVFITYQNMNGTAARLESGQFKLNISKILYFSNDNLHNLAAVFNLIANFYWKQQCCASP